MTTATSHLSNQQKGAIVAQLRDLELDSEESAYIEPYSTTDDFDILRGFLFSLWMLVKKILPGCKTNWDKAKDSLKNRMIEKVASLLNLDPESGKAELLKDAALVRKVARLAEDKLQGLDRELQMSKFGIA